MRVCGDYGLHLTQNLSVGELPKLTGTFQAYTWNNGSPSGVFSNTKIDGSVNVSGEGTFNRFNFNVGNNTPHNNVSACIAVYAWHRTA